jgi:replicative DNA helicase
MTQLSSFAPELPRPYDIESEQQLLGALLLDNAAGERVIGFLEPKHFAEPLHQRIYDAIARAVRAGQPATPFTLKAQFELDAGMRSAGGTRYLAELAALAPGCVDAAAWARALHGLSFRRTLIAAGREIQDAAVSAGIEHDAEKIAEIAERLLGEATAGASIAGAHRFRRLGEVAGEVVAEATSPARSRGLAFGIEGLDALTGGCRAKELVIVGARPGMGKTAFGDTLHSPRRGRAGRSPSSRWR